MQFQENNSHDLGKAAIPLIRAIMLWSFESEIPHLLLVDARSDAEATGG